MSLTPRGYTTKQEVEDYLFADLDPAYDAALNDLIAKAEDYIDRTCRRRFDQRTDDQVVPGNGLDIILIPDTLDLTGFVLDPYYGNLLTTPYTAAGRDTLWTLEPASAPNSDLPYTRLRILDGGLYPNPIAVYRFPRPGKVTLSGTFGWTSVPASIRAATTALVAEATRRWRQAGAGDVQSLTEGNYSVTFAQTAADPEWRRMVTPYKRGRIALDHVR